MKIVINGILGRMGKAIVKLAKQEGFTIVAGVDKEDTILDEIPVKNLPDKLPKSVDCALDFSSPEGTVAIAEWCAKNAIPLVSGTTGLNDKQLEALRSASKKIPLFYATNMSLSVALLGKFASIYASANPDADTEIVEYHHRHKADAPSGTALTLAEKIAQARGLGKDSIIFGRHGKTGERPKKQIGIHAVRAGEITGEHHIIFADETQEVILVHRARSRALFAKGALEAAKWLVKKPCGLYSIDDIVKTFFGGD